MTEKRMSFLVHGTVQGVSFRYFTQKMAVGLGVTGWVRNTSTGKVQGEVQGTPEDLEKFMMAIDRGPTHAHVVKVEKAATELVDGESGFHIQR